MLKIYSVVFFGLMVGTVVAAMKAVPGGESSLSLTILSAAFAAGFMATILSIYKPSK